ncbi:MAG: type 1 glutamine amidotransferase, partial [bacterium]
MLENHAVKVAVTDMYNGIPNEGMRCIKEILRHTNGSFFDIPINSKVYETRLKAEIPDLSSDIFISSGGPGDPFDGHGEAWERQYFSLLESIWNYNEQNFATKKYVFAICHSFQLMARFFKLAEVISRKSTSFGIMPVHKTQAGKNELIFTDLPDPFFAADFRDYQVIHPNKPHFAQLGAEIIAMEKIRPHIDLERAIMGIRITPEIAGVQFHPEADRQSMLVHF